MALKYRAQQQRALLRLRICRPTKALKISLDLRASRRRTGRRTGEEAGPGVGAAAGAVLGSTCTPYGDVAALCPGARIRRLAARAAAEAEKGGG